MAARAVIAARRMLTPRRAALLCGGSSISLYAATRPPALCDAVKSPAEAPSTATPSLEKRCIAEAIGTAIIVQGGCGAVCALKYGGANYGTFGLAAIWGASVALAAYSTRAISGAHLNPAVTCALVANDLFPMEEAPACARPSRTIPPKRVCARSLTRGLPRTQTPLHNSLERRWLPR